MSSFHSFSKYLSFIVIFFITSSSLALAEAPLKVTFISVATKEEPYWNSIHQLSKAAAADLGIDYEILYSERNHIKAIELAKEIASKNDKPDYVIVVGEKLIASSSIPILSRGGIKVFLFGNLNPSEQKKIGEPREIYKNYIGKRAINDFEAGYLTAKKLVTHLIDNRLYDKDGMINILAFEGVRKTAFSSERVRGLNTLVAQYPTVRILQSIPTDWTYNYVFEVLPMALNRYSDHPISGIWCANSAMARAASDFYYSIGKESGVDFVSVGTDWGLPAVQSVEKGEILGVAGGHVAEIAWVLTLIYDYHHGIDFNSNMYLNKVTMMDQIIASKYLEHFKDNQWSKVDFSKYSKAKNRNLKRYNFSFESILNNLDH